MSKLISFQVPAMDKKKGLVTLTKHGKVIWMQVGPKRVKCVLQYHTDETGAVLDMTPDLVHYATGFVIAPSNTLAAAKVSHLMRYGTYATPMSDRFAAETAMAQLINNVGHERILAVMADKPVLNR